MVASKTCYALCSLHNLFYASLITISSALHISFKYFTDDMLFYIKINYSEFNIFFFTHTHAHIVHCSVFSICIVFCWLVIVYALSKKLNLTQRRILYIENKTRAAKWYVISVGALSPTPRGAGNSRVVNFRRIIRPKIVLLLKISDTCAPHRATGVFSRLNGSIL